MFDYAVSIGSNDYLEENWAKFQEKWQILAKFFMCLEKLHCI